MQILPEDIQLAGADLAIRGTTGRKAISNWKACAAPAPAPRCQGEPDALGHIDRPHVTYDPARVLPAADVRDRRRLRAPADLGGRPFHRALHV